MDYRHLGTSGLKVSPLCLGTMMFGALASRETSLRMIDRARDAGVNFIDTSDAYAGGESERVVGDAIRKDRSSWVLATKCGLPMVADINSGGASRRSIHHAVEASLKRLGTDYIDLYYVQVEEPLTSLAETVGAMADLVKSGKIRHYAFSNYKAWRIAEICGIADAMRIDRPAASQPSYNIVNRTSELEQLPACQRYGVGVVASSPLARGVLSGQYAPGAAPPPTSRAGRGDKRILQTEWREESIALSQTVCRHAEQRGMTASQFSTLWVLNNAQVAAAIAGPRTDEQWTEYLGALTHSFTREDEAFVDGLVAPGATSTPGYTDPVFPVEGRTSRC
jgi:aryl-alcohol dehydrogenase-like predicted oxidoreductase